MVVRAVMEYNSGVKLAHENGWKVMSRDHGGHGQRGTPCIFLHICVAFNFPLFLESCFLSNQARSKSTISSRTESHSFIVRGKKENLKISFFAKETTNLKAWLPRVLLSLFGVRWTSTENPSDCGRVYT